MLATPLKKKNMIPLFNHLIKKNCDGNLKNNHERMLIYEVHKIKTKLKAHQYE